MTLSIIIVNYRSWESLEKCLESLRDEASEQPWEVIVVDNHSNDGRLQDFAARHVSVRFIESDWNSGFAAGCNQGAAQGSAPTLLFLNPDVIAEPGSIRALLNVKLKSPDIVILSASQVDARGRLGKVFDMFPDKLTWFRSVKYLLRRLRPDRYPNPRQPFTGLLDCDWVSGSVFMISRVDFGRLGGWREDYWIYSEDRDLCLRARRTGGRVVCSGDIRLIHAHGGASRQNESISTLARTEAIISKHLFVHLNFCGLDRAVNHACVFASVVPGLVLSGLLDLLTLRRLKTLNGRSGVLLGLFRHYVQALRSGDWRSSRVAAREYPV